ncbi:hypothetical protein ABPG74_010163 [Tetrahymena malaccensis]
MKLDNSIVALVTGGTSGLGEATVYALLEKGVRVFIADRNEEKGLQIQTKYGKDRCRFQKCDVSDEAQVKALVDGCVAAFGAIHILLNSAGVISAGLIVGGKNQDQTIKTEEMNRVLGVNVVGTFTVTKYVALQMVKQQPLNEFKERGVIVNVASVAGIEGQRGQTVYAASKGAIIGMTLPLARDLGKFGVRVCTIAPGIFQTPMGAGMSDKIIESLSKASALGRVGNPTEFADAILGLATNSFVTGSIFRLDGGIRLPHM